MQDHTDTRSMRVGPARVRVRLRGSPGSGTPLLLIMGIGGHLDMWDPLSEHLAGRRLVLFDFPGTGKSSLPFFPATMMHNARFVRLLLRRLGLSRVDVLGYSWGGLLAQQLAAQHPAVVRNLILACTGPGIISLPPSPRAAWRLFTPRRYYSPDYLRHIAADTYGGRFRTDDALVREEIERRMDHPPSRSGYAFQLASAATFSSFLVAPFISASTLILAGSDDPLVPTANQRVLHRLIRRSDLRVFAGAGHMLLVERPADVRPTIESFLN